MTTDPEHWYQPIAEFLGPAYLQNAFTKGTVQEIDFLIARLGLDDVARPLVLDAGCGPGRHSLELARRGVQVEGIDISPSFVDLARAAAQRDGLDCVFRVGDLAELDSVDRYDAVVCLCQGGFGLTVDGDSGDRRILEALVRALKPGGTLALSAFSAFFAVTGLWEGEHSFDIATEVFSETAELRDADGATKHVSMSTACYTPRELRMLAGICGLEDADVYGVEPGAYAQTPPSSDLAELLLVATCATSGRG